MNNKSKIQLKSKNKKRPFSYVDKKIQKSNNSCRSEISPKLSDFIRVIESQNYNEISKGYLTDRQLNNDLTNLSYKVFIKENNNLQSSPYQCLRRIEFPQKKYNKIHDNKNIGEDNNELGLSDFFIIKNESNKKIKELTPTALIKGKFERKLSSAIIFNSNNLNLLQKNNSNIQDNIKNYNYCNNKINKNNKKIYNHFNNYKRDIIKNKLLNNLNKKKDIPKHKDLYFNNGYSYEEKENNKSFDIFNTKSKSLTCKTLLYKNKNNSEIKVQENKDNSKCEINNEKIDKNNMDTDSIKIKNKFLIKYAKIVEIYKNYTSNLDWIRVDYRKTFFNIVSNVSKCLEEYNQFILYEYKVNNILSIDIWSNSIKRFYDFCDEILKWQKMVIEEIRFVKKENIHLNKKLFHIENDLNIKDKEIKEINKNIIKYDLNNVKIGKIALEKIEKIKKKYNNHESNYILAIYHLEKELKQLSEILVKNKIDTKKMEELQKNYDLIKEEFDKNKADNKENQYQSEKKIFLLTQYNNELNKKINNYEAEIKTIQNKENEYMDQIIILKSKIEYCNKIINQKDIAIDQLKTEIKKLTDIKTARTLPPANTIFVPCK